MFKSIRRTYWLAQMFIKKHLKVIIQSTSIVLAILVTIILFARYLPTPKHTIKIGRIGKYTLTTLPKDLESQVAEGLVDIDDTGLVTGVLAKSWEISEDGKKYKFTLDTSKTWHDGSKLSVNDITYNFKDVIVERGSDTISYTLSEPFAPFMEAMAQPLLKNSSLGTKNSRISKYKTISGNLSSITIDTPTARYLYKFYPTENSAITAYKLGEIEVIQSLSILPADIASDNSSISHQDIGDKITALFFNNSDSLLSSKTTRQGLAYAIPDKSFGKNRILSPIARSSWAYNDLVKDYSFDLARAKTLFNQDVKNPDEVKLELKTMLPYLDIAESIADSWRQNLGIKVEVKVVSSISNDYQIVLADFTPPHDPDQYTLWHSTQPTNFTKYSNLKIDKLLEDGRRTLDGKLRREIYQDFQRFLLEDSPAIFLFETEKFTITRKPFSSYR
ncbi:MAG: hypothetical protein E6P95_03520 [Candidatus Moraniibacteriota bacterium]|nr:MAG: hypothetical protein E6P95_03520 [Candidatus Moranbacteria bacterium]